MSDRESLVCPGSLECRKPCVAGQEGVGEAVEVRDADGTPSGMKGRHVPACPFLPAFFAEAEFQRKSGRYLFDRGRGNAHDARAMRANQQRNQLRIVGGIWRGRRVSFAPVAGLRPTPDRVRETLFNWLGASVGGARCLDLFAGSGALGLEAASRGAAAVVLVDGDALVVRMLHDQVRALNAPHVRIVQAEAMHYLQGPAEPFDVVFLDPPFGQGLLPVCVRELDARGWLAPSAWVYLEAERGLQLPLPGRWAVHRSKAAGRLGYHLVRRTA
jgi:16S rRNA (guanine966-N2)-methyltransferase